MREVFLVGIGGMVGSIARYGISSLFSSYITQFPFATFIVNVVGCLLIGIVFGLLERNVIGSDMRLLLATGVCGGFTTFSTFSAETLFLLRDGFTITALLYVLLSIILCVVFTFVGLWITKA